MKLSLRRRAPEPAPAPADTSARSILDSFYGAQSYSNINTTYGSTPAQEIGGSYAGLAMNAHRANAMAFAVMEARRQLFAEATFAFRQRASGSGGARKPGPLFGAQGLFPLESPWQGGTTYNLLSRAMQDVDLDGNFYGVVRLDGIRRLRPDWTKIVVEGKGSAAKISGYVYVPNNDVGLTETFVPEEVLHWAPIPDPAFRFRGMSWLIPVIRELVGDGSMTDFKTRFFENGATPNMVVEAGDFDNPDAFGRWVSKFKEGHEGQGEQHKTLFLANGAKATVVGSSLDKIDLRNVQGAGELRIAAAGGVPALIVGVSADVNATYSNYAQARRKFADHTMRPLWRSWCGACDAVLQMPNAGAQVWYDETQISFLQEDVKDAAEIKKANAAAIRTLVDAGFTADTAVKAVESDDMSLLVHSGLFSVQLQAPSAGAPAAPAAVTPTGGQANA